MKHYRITTRGAWVLALVLLVVLSLAPGGPR